MTTQPTEKPDPWSAPAYASAASFVPLLTTKVLALLSPRPGESILDIGCGDGQLTHRIAQAITPTGSILGLDASPSFIATAAKTNSAPNCSYFLHDCTTLPDYLGEARYDKIFSNAALHWILRSEATRRSFFRDAYALLKPNGTFVFEMGGAGNVAELHTAFIAALTTHGGLTLEAARAASPWFFPSETWMQGALEEAGFKVEVCESEYRPTRLTEEDGSGRGGLEGWVRLMGAEFLRAVEGEERREGVVRAVCEWVGGVVQREEDGSKWIGYVRLRAVGRKV